LVTIIFGKISKLLAALTPNQFWWSVLLAQGNHHRFLHGEGEISGFSPID
jgi:hypothetical protein